MIRDITLSNWKSHKSSQLSFQNGTNVLVGSMGAGKSSVLQAISFALFGTFAELKSRDLKTVDIISRDVKDGIAEVELKIDSTKGLLTIKRSINPKKGTHEASVHNEAGKNLAGPNPTAVNDYIKSILDTDEEVFLRTVYAMQNEVDGILRLSPGDRKKRIDELMNLDKFETARKTAQTLRTRLKNEVETTERILSDLKTEDIIGQESTLKKEISGLQRNQKTLSVELISKGREEKIHKVTLDKIREEAEALRSVSNRIKDTQLQISEISTRLIGVELKHTKEDVESRGKIIQGELVKLSDRKASISKDISDKNSLLVVVEREVAVLESKAKDLLTKLGEFQKLELEIESVKAKYGSMDLNSEILKLKSEINSKDEQVKINLAEMESLRKHLEELSSMEGLCPLCKTGLSGTDRNKLISNIKSKLAELLFGNNKSNTDLDKLKKKQNKLEELFETYKDNIKDLEEKEQIREDKNKSDAELEKSKSKLSDLKADIFKIENLLTDVDRDISKFTDEKNKILESKHLYEQRDRKVRLEKNLLELEEEKDRYQISPDILTKAEESFQATVRRVQEIKTKLEGFSSLLNEKQARLKDVEEKRVRMSKLTTNLSNIKNKVEFLDKFKNALQATQLALRDELILTVNEVMSSVWLEIYPYTTWSGVRLAVNENDYVLQIKDDEGDWVNVSGFASGGERTLAALAMRISFARVMAPSLSLLILDEPTHNLDELAVKNFIEVIHEKVSEFIDQILIVTHDERLAESANRVINLV